MKKYVSLLLCFLMLFSLTSCFGNFTKDVAPEDVDPTLESNIYDGVLDLYSKALLTWGDHGCYVFDMEKFTGIQFESHEEKQLFETLMTVTEDYYRIKLDNCNVFREPLSSFGYVLKDFNGDEAPELVLLTENAHVLAVFTEAEEQVKLLWVAGGVINSCWFDKDGVFYILQNNSYIIYKTVGEGALKPFLEFGSCKKEIGSNHDGAWTTEPYQLIDGKMETISWDEYHALKEEYIQSQPVAGYNAVKEYVLPFYTPLFSDFEMAGIMMESVLNNQDIAYVSGSDYGDTLSLLSVPFGEETLRLSYMESLCYACLDIDDDGIEETVIDCGEVLIVLRYYEGRIYRYEIDAHSMNTDGSYNWNFTGQEFVYGETKIFFDGVKLKKEERWRIVNDGEPNAEYYLNGKSVQKRELLDHFDAKPKTKVKFSPLEKDWICNVSYSEAGMIARAYWKHLDFESKGYSVVSGYKAFPYFPWAPSSVYVFVLVSNANDRFSRINEIWIDKATGEAIVPYEPEAKG